MKNSDQLLVGNIVRDLRGTQTQAEFAKRYGRHHNSVSYWERGTPSYPAQLVLDIVQYYSVREVEAFAGVIKAQLRSWHRDHGMEADTEADEAYDRVEDFVDAALTRYKEDGNGVN